MSEAPITNRASSDSHIHRLSPNTMVATPKMPTQTNIFTPTCRFSGMRASSRGGERGADRGRGAQRAEPLRADMKDVAGVDRQHRGGAAEQDGEQVEADRAEHDLVVADIGQALDHRAQRTRGGGIAARDRPDQQHAAERDGVEECRGFVGQAGRDRVSRAAEQRPDDRARLPGDGVHRDRARQHRRRHDVGRDGGQSGTGEGAADAEQHRDGEQRHERHGIEPDQCRKRGGAEHLHGDEHPHDPAPVQPVGDIAGDQGEQEERQELGDADHPQPEARLLDAHARLAGDVVDVDADDDDQHGVADRARQPRRPEGAIIAKPEGGDVGHAGPALGRSGGGFNRAFGESRLVPNAP